MSVQFLFVLLAFVFILAGVLSRVRGDRGPKIRTWLLIGTIFAAVSLWLFSRS
jgi:hypothetical protein